MARLAGITRRRVVLVVLVGLALALIVILVGNVREDRTFRMVAPVAVATVEEVSTTLVGALNAPRYTGQMVNGTAWEVAAAEAQQYGQAQQGHTQDGRVDLKTVTAQWRTATAEVIELVAPVAQYAHDTAELVLGQGVTVSGSMPGWQVTLRGARAEATMGTMALTLRGGVRAELVPTKN
jgi:hypothetical protein